MIDNEHLESKNVVILDNPIFNNKIYIYGSNHASEKSSDEIRDLISFIKPDQIFLEYCIERWKGIESDTTENLIIKPFVKKFEPGIRFINSEKNNTLYYKIINIFKALFLLIQIIINTIIIHSTFFVDSILFKHKCIDMLTAAEEATKINSLCILGDQRISITMKDWISVPTIEILKYIFYIQIPLMLKVISNKDIINNNDLLLQYWDKTRDICPIFYKRFITKRDKHMINILSKCDGKIIFAVVGKVHIKGIKEKWSDFIKREQKYINLLKKSRSDKQLIDILGI